MPELRWILLGLGVLFCIGLWWRESRRPHQAARSSARAGEPARQEPVITAQESPWRAPAEFAEPTEAPEEEPEEREEEVERLPTDAPAPPFTSRAGVVGAQERLARELFSKPVAEMLERIEPILGDTEIIAPEDLPPPIPEPDQTTPAERRGAAQPAAAEPGRAAVEEKILTLRVAAPPLERFDGAELVTALRAAGLQHGKFSIFHKLTANGATVFSVASLVEPGTFDLDRIAGQRLSGISLFAVLPGPMEASATLDTLVSVARDLAARLRGVLQDERGAPLSTQKLADLRASVAEWQRRVDAAAAT